FTLPAMFSLPLWLVKSWRARWFAPLLWLPISRITTGSPFSFDLSTGASPTLAASEPYRTITISRVLEVFPARDLDWQGPLVASVGTLLAFVVAWRLWRRERDS